MRIHLDQLTETELLLEFEEKPQTFPVLADLIRQKECDVIAPIKIRLRVYQVSDIVEVEGNLEARIRLSCSRCLQDYETQLASDFSLTYTRGVADGIAASSPQKELELKAQDLGVIFFNGEEIDFIEGIQEQAVMALPLKPLCQPQCQGLCPNCGADLNREDCTCDRTPKNSQFAALKNVKWD